MSVFYETTPEAVEEVLPPGLKPYKRPIVVAGFNNFSKTNFEVPYVDMGSILGREVGGYPKKWGQLKLKETGSHYEASASRHGVEYYKLKAELSGVPNDPEIMSKISDLLTPPDPEHHPGATIIYTHSEHDPWDSLSVVKTLGAIKTFDGIALDGARRAEDEYLSNLKRIAWFS